VDALLGDMKRKSSGQLPADELWQKFEKLNPNLAKQYKVERTIEYDKAFHQGMNELVPQFPDLGVEARWDKLKETAPEAFWNFVLSVSSDLSNEN
jgi:hypothetical protein